MDGTHRWWSRRPALALLVARLAFTFVVLMFSVSSACADGYDKAEPVPTPCPSAVRTAEPPATTVESCSTAAPLKEVGKVVVTGTSSNLVGTATSASEGTIDQQQIATRPLLRPGDLLEAIPGLVLSQHSGEGKANQYYLRGFQLDHGTDLESTIAGIPINLPTHAHGQGYSDINWLIPELVESVGFRKGTYFADQGDFSAAGSYDLTYRDTIAPTTEFAAGSYGYARLLLAGSPQVGNGHLLYGFEAYHDNESFTLPDEYTKYNGVLRYSWSSGANDYAINGFGYSGTWNSTDQIPLRSIDAGLLNRYGAIDPSDGGDSYRYAVSAQFRHQDDRGVTQATAYAVDSYLDLFSNFTYYLDDATDYYNVTANPVTCNAAYTTCNPLGTSQRAPGYVSYCPANNSAPAGAAAGTVAPAPFSFACGDQREQLDKRFVTGFNLSRSLVSAAGSTTFGMGFRNDNISTIGLFLTNDRIRYAAGTLSDDHVVERAMNLWVQSDTHLGSKLRFQPALRLDAYNFDVAAYDPANSGRATSALLSPKASLAYAFSRDQELYLNFGEGFHSNDARSVVGVDDPQTHAPFDPSGAPVLQNAGLDRSVGEEAGYRFTSAKFSGTVSLWELYLADELVFDGDNGTTSPGGPTQRKGIEVAGTYRPLRNLTFDANLASSTARFLADPLHQGTGVPESLNAVVSLGATLDQRDYSASLRMRYFGPRTLDTQGDAVSASSMLWNFQYSARIAHRYAMHFDVFNIFNSAADDIEYYYGSWLPSDASNRSPAVNPTLGGAGVNDYHLHPTERRAFRLGLSLPM